MFHAYVLNALEVKVDIDRAIWLMDKDIWHSICDRLSADGESDPQVFWDQYCEGHHARYGEAFAPQMRAEPF